MTNWPRWTGQLLGASLMAWAACAAAAEPVRQTRDISQPFSEVRLVGGLDLELTQGDTVSLVIEATPEDLSHIRSDVSDGVLTLRREDSELLNFSKWFSRHPAPRALLSAKAIDRMAVAGSGSIHAAAWSSDALRARIAGSGNLKFDRLTAARFTCEIAGSGDALVAGSVTNQKVQIAGSGQYRAPDLRSQTASVSISGSGSAELWAERTLDVRIAGSGDVGYHGTPAVTRSVSGSGRVTGLGATGAP
ncbi:MAG TPA: head GIN domain-containing protein [Burkholderiaceae bacterium]|jgi:hypothetical protein|nr:head GIN domain-containing protein [Burkholderiaceae bacterium]